MVEYDILIEDVPVGGTAIAHIVNREDGNPADVDTVQAQWYDHNDPATLVEDLTYSGSDTTGTGANGEDSAITKEGTGHYKASLDIHSTYATGSFPKSFRLVVTLTKDSVSDSATFWFNVEESARTIQLKPVAQVTLADNSLVDAIRREAQLVDDVASTMGADKTKFQFNKPIVYEVHAAYKNGARFEQGTTGDTWAWVRYRNWVTLNTATQAEDHFLFRVQSKIDDVSLQSIITHMENQVLGELQPYYGDTSALLQSPTVLNLIKDLVVGEVRQLFSAGVALESSQYRTGMDRKNQALDLLKNLKRGGANALDSDRAVLTRTKGSLVGGPLNANLDPGDQDDLLDRFKDWSKLSINFYDLVRA